MGHGALGAGVGIFDTLQQTATNNKDQNGGGGHHRVGHHRVGHHRVGHGIAIREVGWVTRPRTPPRVRDPETRFLLETGFIAPSAVAQII